MLFMATRRLRAFKRWMTWQGIEHSNALLLNDDVSNSAISITSLCDLHAGDLVATIPKSACLTIKNSAACELIESAGLEGYLGLSVALMFEYALGEASPWCGYLQLLPCSECLPLVWSDSEVDQLLIGTELHKIVKEDKALVREDWKECILPLISSLPSNIDPKFFSLDWYFAAKTLIASRSFAIDDYHGFGMVPLADLFNHKTGAEDVHFTSGSSHSDSENDDGSNITKSANDDDDHKEALSDPESSPDIVDDSSVLEMIMVRDVKAGDEVFNTYGIMGNAALLHRYGFTELDNAYDIVNIDLEMVLQWSSTSFSGRYSRARLSLWRKLGYAGCVSQNSEYFEVSPDGEPQVELLILLYVMLLPDDAYLKLDQTVCTTKNGCEESICLKLSANYRVILGKSSELSRGLLLTKGVRNALLWLASKRESLYGSNRIKDDIEALEKCSMKDRKRYHSLVLRVSERRVLQKLTTFAARNAPARKRSKRT